MTATLYTIGEPLARKIKIPRQTLDSAVKRGAIASHSLGCGTTVVDVADVQRWAVSWRKKGPPKLVKSIPKKGGKRAPTKKKIRSG
jgi:hypothetical protein